MDVRIFLTNLAQYNAGRLIGKWLDLPLDEDELEREIKEVLGNDEEYFVTDYEADFPIGEYEDLYALNAFAEKVSGIEEYDRERLLYLVNTIGHSWDEALEHYEEVTFYEGMRLEDVASDLVEEGIFGELSDQIKGYLDFEKIARDLSIDGYSETDKGSFLYH